MNLSTFKPESYPIIIQVIQGYLSAYQPDFDYRIMEPYRPQDIGQTEMLILKIRRELMNKVKLLGNAQPPLPSKSKTILDIADPQTLTTKDAALILQVSDMTIVRYADEGLLPCKKTPKGHRRFKKSDLIALIESQNQSISTSISVKPLALNESPHTENQP